MRYFLGGEEMKKLDKILALMVAVVMVIGLIPADTFAESKVSEEKGKVQKSIKLVEEQGTTDVFNIEGLDWPEYKAMPDYDISIPAPGRLATKEEANKAGFNDPNIEGGIWWINLDTGKVLEKNKDKFGHGKYAAEMYIIFPGENNAPYVSNITINGQDNLVYSGQTNRNYIWLRTEAFKVNGLANYDKVDEAIANIPKDLSEEYYTVESVAAVEKAKAAVVRGLEITKQNEVDKMAENINKAVKNLVRCQDIVDIGLNSYFYKLDEGLFRGAYNGKQIKAVPIVKNIAGEVLKAGVDYKVTYSNAKRVEVGLYTFTVKGIGKYRGNKECILIITPKAVSNVKVRLGAYNNNGGGYDDAYLTWNKSKGADGYYVYMRRPNIKDNAWKPLGRVIGTSLLKKDLADGYKYEFKVLPYVERQFYFRTTGNFKVASVQTLMKAKINTVKKYNNERTRLTWTNVKGVTGYQVMVSANGNTRYFTINSPAANAKVVRNAKTTFKVRAYKDVKNNSGKTVRVYAPWSDGKIFTLR